MKVIVLLGILGDRMVVMIFFIQDDVVYIFQFVEIFVNFVKKKGSKQQCFMVLDIFKELFIIDFLLDSWKLRIFSQYFFDKLEQLFSGNKDLRDRRLILWYFEYQLKYLVVEFVQVLEILSYDILVIIKI